MRNLLSSLAIGTVLLSSCYKQSDFEPLSEDLDNVIVVLRATPEDLPANGTSTSTIIAQLPDDGIVGVDISFRTSRGVFTESNSNSCTVKSKVAVLDGVTRVFATATLRSTQTTGTATVTAQLAEYEKQCTVNIGTNAPTALSLSVPTLVMQDTATSELEITAQLTSTNGPVTIGQTVDLEVMDPAMNPRGSFRLEEDQSNADGKCRFVFSIMPDTAYTGPLVIRGSTAGIGVTLQDSLTIYVLN